MNAGWHKAPQKWDEVMASVLEPKVDHGPAPESSDRGFGIVFAVVFALFAGWPLWHGAMPRWWAAARATGLSFSCMFWASDGGDAVHSNPASAQPNCRVEQRIMSAPSVCAVLIARFITRLTEVRQRRKPCLTVANAVKQCAFP